MKPDDMTLIKGKMEQQVGYKKNAMFLDEQGKQNIIRLLENGSPGEVQQQQVLDTGVQTVTIKIYFKPPPNG